MNNVKLLSLTLFIVLMYFLPFIDLRAQKPENAQIVEGNYAKLQIAYTINKENIKIQFQVIPLKNLVINPEGPWALQILEYKNLKLDKTKYGFSDLEKQSIFVVSAKLNKDLSSQKELIIKYKLTSFVCTADKNQCFKETFNKDLQIKI